MSKENGDSIPVVILFQILFGMILAFLVVKGCTADYHYYTLKQEAIKLHYAQHSPETGNWEWIPNKELKAESENE